MVRIKELFEQNQIGLTMYSPDALQSRLLGQLDHAIYDHTGFQVVYRQWLQHDYNSIVRFYTPSNEAVPEFKDPNEMARKYAEIPVETLQAGHLVVRHYLSGASLLTLWQGEQALERLSKLKGRTQPAESGADTLRGRFWCDNGVCNLVHVSDNLTEAEHELKTLQLDSIFDQTAEVYPLMEVNPVPMNTIAHSGIIVVCEVVKRVLGSLKASPQFAFELPESGNARETNERLTGLLQRQVDEHLPNYLKEFIQAYLAGDIGQVSHLLKQVPVTAWEGFAIQCGAINRDTWNKTSAESA